MNFNVFFFYLNINDRLQFKNLNKHIEKVLYTIITNRFTINTITTKINNYSFSSILSGPSLFLSVLKFESIFPAHLDILPFKQVNISLN